jgi:DNA end-binding protein Ku
MVQIPVTLHKATEDHDVGFNGYCPHCTRGRIGMQKYCKECKKQCGWNDPLRGTEVDGKLVFVSDAEMDSLEQSIGKHIELLEFVDRSEIHPIMYESSYYVGAPDSSKAYALLTQGMLQLGLFGIVQLALRSKKQRAALEVLELEDRLVLALHMLRWPDEVRAPEVPGQGGEYSAKEMTTALTVIESMVDEFDPDSWVDERQMNLHDLLAAKAEGAEYVVEAPVELDATGDENILDQLEASIQRHPAKGKRAPAKKAAKAPAKRRGVA